MQNMKFTLGRLVQKLLEVSALTEEKPVSKEIKRKVSLDIKKYA